jgi:hypothetical protein
VTSAVVRCVGLAGALLLMLAVPPAQAENWYECLREGPTDPGQSANWRLETHEPNRLGYTADDSGKFMDFTVSLKFPIVKRCVHRLTSENFSTLIAFSGRLGQYFGRESSPVIGKRFNPEWIMVRHEYAGQEQKNVYYEFAYAHESNGQRIRDLVSYQQTQSTLERPEYAEDYISRGWDFFRFTLTSPEVRPLTEHQPVQLWFAGKWFQKHGLFQGLPEEYNTWEADPEGKPRKEVDGLSVGVRYQWVSGWPGATGMTASVSHTTGYQKPFRYNTLRFEGGVRIVDAPVVLWWAHGYNADLARYFNKSRSFGIAVVLQNK